MDIHDYQALLTTEPIASLQIHLYNGQEMIFSNTFLRETAKLFPPSLVPSFVTHHSPANALGPTPLAVLNQTYIKTKQDLFKLVIALVESAQQQPGVGRVGLAQVQELALVLQIVLKQYEELSEVATVLTQTDLNPYWLLLNPLLKWRQTDRLEAQKQRIYSCSQFFNKNQLNTDYFLYRLNQLEQYLDQLKGQRVHKLSLHFIKICQLALLKHVQANHPPLLKVLLQQPSLSKLEENKLSFLLELSELQQKAANEGNKKMTVTYGNFTFPGCDQPVKEKEEDYITVKERVIRALIKPVSVTGILLILLTVAQVK